MEGSVTLLIWTSKSNQRELEDGECGDSLMGEDSHGPSTLKGSKLTHFLVLR